MIASEKEIKGDKIKVNGFMDHGAESGGFTNHTKTVYIRAEQ